MHIEHITGRVHRRGGSRATWWSYTESPIHEYLPYGNVEESIVHAGLPTIKINIYCDCHYLV